MSKWYEIHSDNFDEYEECYTVDAWLTDDENEQGKVIAKIYTDGGKGTVYLDEDAKTDTLAQELIDDRIMRLEAIQ